MLKKISVISIFISLIIFGCLCASAEDIDGIMLVDALNPDNLTEFDHCFSGDNILLFLKAREKLLTYSYEDLCEISNKTKALSPKNKLKIFVDRLISKIESEPAANEKEDIFVNNFLEDLSSPFSGGIDSNFNIRNLEPHAERIYKNNLILKPARNPLLEKTTGFFVNPKYIETTGASRETQDKADFNLSPFEVNKKIVKKWEYRLKDDLQQDFFFRQDDLRQWFKRFEEYSVEPAVYKNTVILRNEYRVFCLDLKTSNEIWSFGNIDGSCYEFYNTFRHPHQNSRGYEILLSNDMLFTELDHKLIALKLNNILLPEISWQKDMGEFTLCAKPVLNKETLITCLVNARGEIFICGFSSSEGKIKWSTYVGISSFLSPVSSLSCVNGNEVIIGTNYGVITSIDSDTGAIIWLRKYLPKKYNIFEYWKQSCFKVFPMDKCPIEYDTEFVQPDNGRLYYKPRESNYLYIIGLNNGELNKQFLIDPDNFYILWAARGKAVFLEKPNNTLKKPRLKLVNLDSGATIDEFELEGQFLHGVTHISEESILIKLDNIIYSLSITDNSMKYKEVVNNINGWLVNAAGNDLFIADGNNLLNYALDETGLLCSKDSQLINNYIREQNDVSEALTQALCLDPGDSRKIGLKKQVLDAIREKNIPLNKLMPVITGNLERLKNNFWDDFIVELQKKYADQIVRYDNVSLRFDGFLKGASLVKNNSDARPINKIKSKKTLSKKYKINGALISPVPITVIKGGEELVYYLIRRFDQIICLDESGNILWFRNTFKADQAFLYDNTLIIKDEMNAIGVDAASGRYIWSISKDARRGEESVNRGSNFILKFLGKNAIIILGDKIYSVDIVTGYSRKSLSLSAADIKSLDIYKETIYVRSSLKNLRIYDKDINYIGDIPLDFIKKDSQDYETLFIKGFIIYNVYPEVYVIDTEKKKIVSKLFMGHKGVYFLDTYKNNLLKIIPSTNVSSYRLSSDGFLSLDWVYNFKIKDGQLWGFSLDKASFRRGRDTYDFEGKRYYFISGNKIFLPYRNENKYYIAALDLISGRKNWESCLSTVRGVFDHISNIEEYSGSANFIISTKRQIDPPDTYAEFMRNYIVNIRPKLVKMDLNSGRILRIVDLPDTCKYYIKAKSVVTQTKSCYIYGVHDLMVASESK